ncbi:tripartite motif-containing protein 5-like isoform X6 [Pipistrellus kuhlii]|uniref:tripartite motif-containing protein 5-like isoform X6 n=1 Tax=Pipistrellus kuhlii TaxID=59472 RepID=UPI001E27019A|nr:tripartite motif-containing protein 5-like isoform X6 [Pipistrellus kuhlii]
MASGVLVNIKEEVTCPICLELLTEPMSLDCGHTFCQGCIIANNSESMMGQESSCPMCRISYQPENLRPNRHVTNIVEALREVKLSPQEEQKRDLCMRHGERLLLFCKEDERIICWLCERSQEHRGHQTFLLEEIAPEYKEKLQSALDRLRAEQQKAEKLEDDLAEEITSKLDQTKNELKSVQDSFEQLRGILASEELKELQRLEKEAAENFDNLAQAESELAQQRKLLRDLISDLEHRLQGSTVEMLQDVKDTMKRSKNFTLKKPKSLSTKQRRVFQAPDLRGMLEAFNELTDVRCYWVNVTLDPPPDESHIIISADRRQVKPAFYLKTCDLYPKGSYKDYGVLGSLPITSGKHYWEVDVSDEYDWALGVCTDFRVTFVCRNAYSQYQPKYGYWVIGFQNHSEYKAFVDSDSIDPMTIPLFPNVPPCRVGVFLDYDAGTVSFFNVTANGFLIYKFSSCSFSQKMFPYFSPMEGTAPMTLCSPGS